MATPTALADAYREVREAETKVITDMDALRASFLGSLDEVAAQLPDEAAGSPAASYLVRVRSAVAGVFGFDIVNLKATYGIVDPAPEAPES